jgi:hypothetical protein
MASKALQVTAKPENQRIAKRIAFRFAAIFPFA